MSHHHDSHGASAAAAPGEASTLRCKRRWNDLVLLRLDALAPHTYSGPKPRFSNEADVYKAIRERYLLFAACVESKPGAEPSAAYLYPQAAVTAAAAPVHH